MELMRMCDLPDETPATSELLRLALQKLAAA